MGTSYTNNNLYNERTLWIAMQYTFTITTIEDNLRDITAIDKENNVYVLSDICPQEREQRLLESTLREYEKYSEPVGIVIFGAGSGRIERAIKAKDIPYLLLDIEGIVTTPEKEDNAPLASQDHNTIVCTLQSEIFKWQIAHKGMGFLSIVHPFHKKLYKEYSEVAQIFANNVKYNLFKEMRARPRFERNRPIRMIVIPDYYCMTINITNAARALGVEIRDVLLTDHNINEEWYVNFLNAVIEFKPDFILTFNHLGISEGYNNVITNIAEGLGIPIASWFVDSPDVLIGYEEQHLSSLVHVFLWEETRVPQVQALGYQASYLPLATDPFSFYPVRKKTIPKRLRKYKSELLFVGAVGVQSGVKVLSRNIFPYTLYTMLPQLYKEFIASPIIGVKEFLDSCNIPEYESMKTIAKQEFSAYFFFYMHTERRVQLMLDIADIHPMIAGEEGWNEVLPPEMLSRVLPSVDYVLDLTCVYQLADINLNTTSPQMKHAVNQRVFDVPVSEAFVLTDYQPALPEFFDVGKEIIAYQSIDELKDLYDFYKRNPQERKKIISAGRKRILSEHLYTHRLQQLIMTMKEQFGILE